MVTVLTLAFPLQWVNAEDSPVTEDAAAAEEINGTGAVSGKTTPAVKFQLRDEVDSAKSQRSGGDLIKMLLGLLGVLAVIGALVWLSRRLNVNIPGANQQMKVVSALSIGIKEKLIVVQVDGERLLLGVTPQSIRLLKTLDADTPLPEDNSGEFANKMRSLLRTGVTNND